MAPPWQESAKTWVGAPTSRQHVPLDKAGPGLGVPARPSGLSFLSDPGHRAPPVQEGRWGVAVAARPRAPPMPLREMGLGPAATPVLLLASQPFGPTSSRPPRLLSACFLSPASFLFCLLSPSLHLPPSFFPPAPTFSPAAPHFLSTSLTFSPRSLRSPFSPRGPGKP